MSVIEIEYCVPCGLRPPALSVQSRLLKRFERDVDAVITRTGSGGVFVVRVDGAPVFDNAHDAFDLDLITERVRARLLPEA